MTPFLRYTTIALSTALTGGLAIEAAHASPWSPAQLLADITGQSAQQATPAAAAPLASADPAASGNSPAADPNAPIQVAANTRGYRDGSYAGPVSDAYYGLVQVQANIQGGRLVSIDVLQYPSDRRTSRAINSQALPMLESEVVAAQSTRVDIVSGATLTSNAYLRSLSGALRKANA